jgi:ABC-type Na+ transport system ATPase subunit NatA
MKSGVSMLEIDRLTKRFGAKTAVDGVSLRIPAGQMVGVIGRSGAGKSTLLRMINRSKCGPVCACHPGTTATSACRLPGLGPLGNQRGIGCVSMLRQRQ